MAKTQTPTAALFPLWESDGAVQEIERYSTLPDAANLKATTLFGIPLRSSLTGETISDMALEQFIKEAISEIEHLTALFITPISISERHDYSREMWEASFAYMRLNHSNILDIQAVQLSFVNTQGMLDTSQVGWIDFPREFVYFNPQEGTLQLVPAYGTTMGGFLLSAFSGVQYYALRNLGLGTFPGAVRVKYRCGFENDKIPSAIAALISTTAALNILSVIAPLLFPYTSVSVSADGLGQSTGSLGPHFLAKRIEELRKRKDELLDAVKTYYSRKFLVDYV